MRGRVEGLRRSRVGSWDSSGREKLWPNSPSREGYSGGFSSDFLEELCGAAHGKREVAGWRHAPWIYSGSEMYGMGNAIRRVTGWPQSVPIPFSADHGVTFFRQFEPVEHLAIPKSHLTFSTFRAGSYLEGKSVFRVQHPWVLFRKLMKLVPKDTRQGTIVFVDHAMPDTEEEEFDWAAYFESLKDLGADYQPISICLHQTDISRGLHRQLERYGLPMFTAGNTSSPLFIERFYDILLRHRYSTSTRIGTHAFISEEAGVNFFLWGDRRLLINSDPLPDSPYLEEKAESVFSSKPADNQWEKNLLVLYFLSLDVSWDESVLLIRKHLTRGLVRSGLLAMMSALKALLSPQDRQKFLNDHFSGIFPSTRG